MAECYLSLGSNLGDRLRYIKVGLESISKSSGVEVLKTSSIYESDPVDYVNQPAFLNLAAEIQTHIGPLLLLRVLKAIETEVGRIPRERSHEREFDVDIIFYGNLQVDSENLVIPHPRAHLRRFVLVPIAEIAPDYVHPVFKKTINQLLMDCPDKSRVVKIEELNWTAE